MYKTILVPLDGSKRAEEILPQVEEMACRFEAKVVFVEVVESHSTVAGPYGMVDINVADFENRMMKADAYLRNRCEEFHKKHIEAQKCVEHGPIVETILDVAVREDADLIAMVSHGRSGLSRVFYGSVAAGILQRVDRPLLLTRSQGHA